jgi:hypothetical protein
MCSAHIEVRVAKYSSGPAQRFPSPAISSTFPGAASWVTLRQNAVFWELRPATSLARLWLDRHRAAEARAYGPVYSRFTDGFGTDLQGHKLRWQ